MILNTNGAYILQPTRALLCCLMRLFASQLDCIKQLPKYRGRACIQEHVFIQRSIHVWNWRLLSNLCLTLRQILC